MDTHLQSGQEWREPAGDDALGALPAAEKAAFDERLRRACAAELAFSSCVAGELGLTAPPQEPPRRLQERLFERIAAMPQ